jgi:hypothetical protein
MLEIPHLVGMGAFEEYLKIFQIPYRPWVVALEGGRRG